MIELKCDNCGKLFQRKLSEHKGNLKRGRKIITCSHNCSSAIQRIHRERSCLFCKEVFTHGDNKQLFCSRLCSNKSRYKPKEPLQSKLRGVNYSLITIQMLRDKYSTSAFHAKVRSQARSSYKQSGGPMICANCGYSLHVDICHIKDVSSFGLDALISEVNSPENLIALDKRCHWEFDHGYLSL